MAWELRGNHRYYYHSHRINGRVVKEYMGRGPLAEAAAALIEARRDERQQARRRAKAAKQTLAAADAALASVETAAALVSAPRSEPHLAPPCSRAATPASPEETVERLKQLLAMRARGDETAESGIRGILELHPELWTQLGDLGAQAIEVWLNLTSGNDQLMKEALRAKLDDLRKSFESEVQDAASRLLVDRIVATWLQSQYADLRYSQAGDAPRATLDFLAARQDQAGHQHLQALKAWRVWQALAPPRLAPVHAVARNEPDAAMGSSRMPEPLLVPFPTLRTR